MILPVTTTNGSYEIHLVTEGLHLFPKTLLELTDPRSVVLSCNSSVYTLYGRQLQSDLERSGFTVILLKVPDGEQHKNLSSYTKLIEELDKLPIDRKTPLIALGGGVTGDLAGFVASTILRGLPLIQVPTTLLSMVDSSIGGKVGINTDCGKNRVGSFYQPTLVFISTDVLKTLPKSELNSGTRQVFSTQKN